MKTRSLPYLLLIVSVIFFVSCSKKARIPVPEDAVVVVHFDGASLNSKLSWDEIKQGELYMRAMENVKDSLALKILDNPENSGIDIKSDAYFFVEMQRNNSYSVFTCSIKDEKAFTAFMQKIAEGKAITKKEGLSIISIDNALLSWNSDRFIIVGNEGLEERFTMKDRFRKQPKLTEDSLIKFATSIYDLKSNKSIGSDSRFADMIKDKGDIHFWMNPGAMFDGNLPGVLMLTKASTLFEGNATAATLNFENGKISVDGKNYYNKELSDLYKKFSMKNVDENMLKKIPSDNVAAVIAMNYPPEGLKAFINLMGVDGLANMFLAESGLSIDDFVKAFKGDMLLSVSDFGFVANKPMPEKGKDFHERSGTRPDAKILFATSVNDKTSFEKLFSVFNKKMNEGRNEEMENKIKDKIKYQLNNDWFIAGTDSVQVNTFGTTNKDHSFISKISGHPMGGYLDIQKFITGSMPLTENDSLSMQIGNESLKYWQDVVFYGGEFKDGAAQSHLEINMVDKNTNSLKQLNNYINLGIKIYWEKQKMIARMFDKEMEFAPAPGE